MRLLPIITALLVAGFLFVVLIQRDAFLQAIGRAVAPPEAVVAETVAEPVRVVAIHSRARDVDTQVMLRGETRARRQVEVRAETSGRVISPPLRRGASITEGEVLCELDPGTRFAALEEARARLADAEINDRAATSLRERGFAAETQTTASRAAVQAARAGVEVAETEIDRLKIRAPFAGSLEDDTAELGELLQPGSICATVIELDPINIVGYVPEAELHRVELGARAGARLVDGRRIAGTVTFIARAADPETRTFRVDIEAPNADLSVRSRQTAEIAIEAPGDKAHLLPGSVLTLDDAGTLGVRTVDGDGIAGFAPVTLLRDTGEGVLVTGLPDSVDIVVTGQEYVIPGQKVETTYREPGT